MIYLLSIFLILSAFGVIYNKHRSRTLNKQLVEMRQQHEALKVQWDQYRLEHSTFVSHQRIETAAVKRLKMDYPKQILIWVKNQ